MYDEIMAYEDLTLDSVVSMVAEANAATYDYDRSVERESAFEACKEAGIIDKPHGGRPAKYYY